MDDFSRFLRAVAIPNINQDTVANAFKDNWFAIFGCPYVICDDGKKYLLLKVVVKLHREHNSILNKMK